MKIKKLVLGLGLAVVAVSLSGCATIVGDSAQSIQVNSSPAQAKFIVKDNSGVTVARGLTPQSVSLEKSDGSYFGKKEYTITFCKDGYKQTSLPINSDKNGWYIGGNIMFGGLIGWFGVDPFHGGMYTLSPEKTNVQLLPEANGSICDSSY